MTYTHFCGPTNPIVNVETDVPSLPIGMRQARPARRGRTCSSTRKHKPIPEVDQSFKDDVSFMSMVHNDQPLSSKQIASVERVIQSISVELTTEEANALKIQSAITGMSDSK